ncbi:DUF1684 domain-containing protein [Streptomyces sp. BI20]|uniref:DUF1684 domain-containing protein n=1 Tax=Streptomyces sp. BI20 TaxID=3403460 RepID=UPI003C751916
MSDRDDRAAAWRDWHDARLAGITAPYGPLALTGTHWLADHPDGELPDLPGTWRVGEDADTVLLTASAADGITLDGAPVDGTVTLGVDENAAGARVALGERRVAVLRREGEWAVRPFDPAAETRAAFPGVVAAPYDPAWVLPGRFEPYDDEGGVRTVRVENADGRERGLGLGGELVFEREGVEHRLKVVVDGADGGLWAVFADESSGGDSYRFRFLRPGAPAADGSIDVDLNRVTLPPCALVDHFICPFPPPGNTLPFAVDAGERRVGAAELAEAAA